LTRWTLLLQEFDLRIKHIAGPNNIIDTLSRNPVGRDESCAKMAMPCIFWTTPKWLVKKHQSQIQFFGHVLSEQRQDPHLSKIIESISTGLPLLSPVSQRYCLFQGTLFYRRYESSDNWLVCIPLHRIDELLMNFHEHYGHVGPKKCIAAIRDVCYFRGISRRTRRIIRGCDICQRTKPSTVRIEGEMQHVMADAPLSRVCVDLYGPLPSGWNNVKFIFVVLDCFTRFVRLYPIKRSTAVAVTNRMENDYIASYGVPQTIVSDHGVQFVSKVWKRRLSELGSIITHTSVYHPQSNPAERVMRELGRLFRTYCHENHIEWPQYVFYIEWVLNNTVHEATGFTPNEMFLKQDRYNPFIMTEVKCPPGALMNYQSKLTMANEIQLTKAEQRRRRHNQRGAPVIFEIGDRVLVRAHRQSSAVDQCIRKFFLLYEGPYKIIEVKCRNAYVLVDPETNLIQGTFNVIFLRQYVDPVL